MIEEDFIVFSDFLKEKYGLIYGPLSLTYGSQLYVRFFIPFNKNLEEHRGPRIHKRQLDYRSLTGEAYFSINFNLTTKHIYINLKKTNGGLRRLYSFRSISAWPEIRFTQTPIEFSDIIKEQWQNIVQIIDKNLGTL